MKGLLGLQSLALIMVIVILFGQVALGVIESITWSSVCFLSSISTPKNCGQYYKMFAENTAKILSKGQIDVNDGVNGLIALQEKKIKLGESIDAFDILSLKAAETNFKNQIFFGTITTLIYISVIYIILIKIANAHSGFEPTWTWNLVLALIITGLLYIGATAMLGKIEMPYGGWINLLTHLNLILPDLITVVSPVV